MRIVMVFGWLLFHSISFAQADTNILLTHLKTLVETHGSRYYKDTATLNNAADYIKTEFKKYSVSVSEQMYEVKGRKYKNIICSFDTSHAERIVIGAHYDVCDPLPGADDNATGVAGLLELARMMSDSSFKSNYRIDLVAYTLEEPPFFRTENMGSYVHAKSLHDKGIKVRGMISLEMIGYFSDERKSQSYPLGIFKLFYGGKGNFITVVQKTGGGKFVRKFKRKMKRHSPVETKGFKSPAWVTGVDFSDHLNYWKFDIPAMMITDTSFFRNKNYHTAEDTIEKLDLKRMAQVVDGVFITLNKMIQ
jgi:Zn-dependent M28 family amino/carboxypeptidase